MVGQLDEIRISSTARSACWIQSEVNNQDVPIKDPACTDNGFICVGTEEVQPTAVELVKDNLFVVCLLG